MIVNRFAPVLAARPAFCVVDRPAHFLPSPSRESVICCRCGSACLTECDENGRRGTVRTGRRLAARRRARRAGEADILVLRRAEEVTMNDRVVGTTGWRVRGACACQCVRHQTPGSARSPRAAWQPCESPKSATPASNLQWREIRKRLRIAS